MSARKILIDLDTQQLHLADAPGIERRYPVSSAANGAGERNGSGRTPRGLHIVRIKIGAGCAEGAVFRGRRWTGEVYSDELARCWPNRDWILTRILWLSGLEPGINRGGQVDTLRRCIYIHGCPDCEPMSVPRSHGCIRMRNKHLIELFDLVRAGIRVEIR